MSLETLQTLVGLGDIGRLVNRDTRQQIAPSINFTCNGVITNWIVGGFWVNNLALISGPELQPLAYPGKGSGCSSTPISLLLNAASGLRNSVYALYSNRSGKHATVPTRKVRVDISARPGAVGDLLISAHAQLTPLCEGCLQTSLTSYFASQFISLYVVLEAFNMLRACGPWTDITISSCISVFCVCS